MKEMKIRITFQDDLLGTMPGNEEIFRDYVAQKAETVDEEAEAISLAQMLEKGTTVFPRTASGEPFIYDYQFRGFFKEACKFLKKVTGTRSANLKAYKQEIDGLIFVMDRRNIIDLHGMKIGICERPLRASTPQGDRVALSRSESVPAGSTVDFRIRCLVDADIATVKEWLDYGELHGTGQWRNSGAGRFTWKEIK